MLHEGFRVRGLGCDSSDMPGRKPQPFSPADVRVDIDYEAMSSDAKVKLQAMQQERISLKAQLQRLHAQMRKKDQELQHVLELKEVQLIDKYGETHLTNKIQQLKKEMTSSQVLADRVRSLEQEVITKNDELKLLKTSLKYTLIKELQVEAQTYYMEARRMKKMLDVRVGAKHRDMALAHSRGGKDGVDRCRGCDSLEEVKKQLQLCERELQLVRAQLTEARNPAATKRATGKSATGPGKKKKQRGRLKASAGPATAPLSSSSMSSSSHVKVELVFSCSQLPTSEHGAPVDSLAALFERDPSCGKFRYFDQTEFVANNTHPEYHKRFLMAHRTSEDAELKVNIYNVSGEDKVRDKDKIGSAVFSLNQVINEPGRDRVLPLTHTDPDAADLLGQFRSTVCVRAAAVSLISGEELARAEL